MLTRVIVIILQYIQIRNHCHTPETYMPILPQLKKKTNTHGVTARVILLETLLKCR